MHDVDQQSPSTTSPGARGEVGERATAPHSTARSLHLTWAEFCSSYKPGRWNRYVRPATIVSYANELELLLIGAHLRLDRLDALAELPHRRVQRSEETSAGSCYGTAA